MGIEGIEREVQRIQDEAKRQFGLSMRAQKRAVGVFAFTKGNELTPIDEGEARRGWHFSSPRPTQDNVPDQDGLAELVKLTEEGAPEDPVYLQNRVDHIDVLDQGLFQPPNPGPSKDPREGRTGQILVRDGYSAQAPQGISGDLLDAVAARFSLRTTKEGA
jgi:hypothetical protein